MVVLVVIGVLTCILTPIVANSIPDKNVMKFKKADTTLKNIIRELVNSNHYGGDLGRKFNGDYIDNGNYFCNTFVDTISTKSNKCNEYQDYFERYNGMITISFRDNRTIFDEFCKQVAPTVGDQIITPDGISYFETTPGYNFAGSYKRADGIYRPDNHITSGRFKGLYENDTMPVYSYMYFRYDGTDEPGHYNNENATFHTHMKVFCIDIDGVPSNATKDNCVNECPFGYGITVDGKITNGPRVQQWLEKDFQGNDPSEQE